MADSAPDEISDEAQTAADVSKDLFDAVEDVDPTDEEAVGAALEPFFDDEADPAFANAVDTVNEFALTECGIDLEESG